jgi:hypothetical protein
MLSVWALRQIHQADLEVFGMKEQGSKYDQLHVE